VAGQNQNKQKNIHYAAGSGDLGRFDDSNITYDDVNREDRYGRTALFYASMKGNIEIIKKLLKLRADVNKKDKNGQTALHFAAREQQLDATIELLNSNADIDTQDNNGNTPLSDAVFTYRGDFKVIKELLARGADRHKQNKYGVSPHTLANSVANYNVKEAFD
jgi:uncharacterized protein